jgi:hypothetical protein
MLLMDHNPLHNVIQYEHMALDSFLYWSRDVKITWQQVWAIYRFLEQLLLHGPEAVGYTGMGIVVKQDDAICDFIMKFFLIEVSSF